MGHYPAVDVLRSTSRVMPDLVSAEHLAAAMRAREILSLLADSEDLVSIGAYQKGKNPRLDEALARKPALISFLRQLMDESNDPQDTIRRLGQLGSPLPGGAA
jgi:flagellar biosynthesis/type III secretory pathway ATPase